MGSTLGWIFLEHCGKYGGVINTPNEETRPFESFDGQRFYFSNNHGQPRPGISYGGASDIYVSTWTDSGWGPVYLVAAPINCDLTACSPCESPDGMEIWFGSEAWEGSRGDEDIWVARKGVSPLPRMIQGYGKWLKTGDLENVIFVYDLEESTDGTIYAATACAETEPQGKVFKTNNGGISWTACADLPGAMTVYSLVVDGDTLYAGTYPHGDVFKSINRGNSWIPTANLPEATSARSLVRLDNGDILVGTSPYDVTMRNSIYRTSDGGKSWIPTGLLSCINPCKFLVQISTGAIFAGGWGIDNEIIIHKSVDNGITWDGLTVISQIEPEWTADGFYETKEGILYVSGWIPSHGPGTATGGYVCKSIDQGASWTMCTKIMRGDGVHSGRVYSIVEDQFSTLYVGMQPALDSVVYASSDKGSSWHSPGGLEGAFECLCLLRASDGAIYAGTTPNGDVFKYIPQPATQITENFSTVSLHYQLAQNYPNPFNMATNITYHLPKATRITLKIYDIQGQEIKTLIDEYQTEGTKSVGWDGLDNLGQKVTSGVYFYKMDSFDFSKTKKMIILQ